MKDETVEAVRERERATVQQNKYRRKQRQKASICDREKDREQTDCIKQED